VDPIEGARLEMKRVVRNADGVPMRRMVSQQYEAKDFYGLVRVRGSQSLGGAYDGGHEWRLLNIYTRLFGAHILRAGVRRARCCGVP
jgi:hypothetical protein